jgi:hypothetical protein
MTGIILSVTHIQLINLQYLLLLSHIIVLVSLGRCPGGEKIYYIFDNQFPMALKKIAI